MKNRRFSACALSLALLFALSGCVLRPSAPASVSPSPSAAGPTPPVSPSAPSPEGASPSPFVLPDELVGDLYHVEFDRTDDYRLDITLPAFREDLPGTDELNAAITEDFAYYLSAEAEHFFQGDVLPNFSYSFVHVWYELYAFDSLCELVVRSEEYSLYGSGVYSFNCIYCYDAEVGAALSLTDFLERLSISAEDVLAAAQTAYPYEGTASFDELIHFFYLDGDKQICFEPNT